MSTEGTESKVTMVSPVNPDVKVNVDWQVLEGELRRVMNMFHVDAVTNTPDFLLAEFLTNQLRGLRRIMKDRDKWHETGAMKS